MIVFIHIFSKTIYTIIVGLKANNYLTHGKEKKDTC